MPVPVPVDDPANPPGRFAFTGYFNLVSVRTTEMAKFGTDMTPGGRPGSTRNFPVPTSTSTDRFRGSRTRRSHLGRRR